MLRRTHDKVGTAGFVIAIMALVVALGGVAYAALPGLNSKQKKQVKNIAKQFAGQPGAAGPKGDQGPKGDAGAPSAPGKDGENGEDGACSVINNECVLPPGGTLTGAWAFRDKISGEYYVSLSFPLRVAPKPEVAFPEETNHCPGSAAEPKAEPGFVCIYAEQELNTFLATPFEPNTSGMVWGFEAANAEQVSAGRGTWAVTQRCPTDPETELEIEC